MSETETKNVNNASNSSSEKSESSSFITDKEIFTLAERKISKYGEDVANQIKQEYSKGVVYDQSVKEDILEQIDEKARQYKQQIENEKKHLEIENKISELYKNYNLEAKEAENIIKKVIDSDSKMTKLFSKNPNMLSDPTIVESLLDIHKENVRLSEIRFDLQGQSSSEKKLTRLDELELKNRKINGLNPKERQEYQFLLEKKYLKTN